MKRSALHPAAVTAAVLALLATGRPAEAEPLRVTYQAHVGGLTALSGSAALSLRDGRYDLRVEAETAGLIGRLLTWRSQVKSRGAVAADGTLRPERHELSSLWREETRTVLLAYDRAGGVTATAVPPPKDDEREPVPEELQRDTLDPVSAILAVLLAVGDGAGCGRTVPVFDGRRRYDMIVQDLGSQTVAASDYSSFAGTALHCRVTYRPVAGYSRKPPPSLLGRSLFGRGTPGTEPRPPVDVWVAPIRPGEPPVPVRIETESGLGGIVVHVTEARGP